MSNKSVFYLLWKYLKITLFLFRIIEYCSFFILLINNWTESLSDISFKCSTLALEKRKDIQFIHVFTDDNENQWWSPWKDVISFFSKKNHKQQKSISYFIIGNRFFFSTLFRLIYFVWTPSCRCVCIDWKGTSLLMCAQRLPGNHIKTVILITYTRFAYKLSKRARNRCICVKTDKHTQDDEFNISHTHTKFA